ncbi:MAG: DUF559 domain-containing protein [Bacteroidetes bacterium]|nr:DUF559 domain-containing protein [Bacteroidota bacterium]
MRKERITKQCKYCNKTFTLLPSKVKQNAAKFCSKHCSNEAKRQANTIKYCNVCNESFNAKQDKSQKYCSRICFGIANRGHRTKTVNRICKTCGKTFMVLNSKLKHDACSYCSKKCSHAAKIKQVKKECLVCKKEFNAMANKVKKGYSKYCSRQCFMQSTAETDIEAIMRKAIEHQGIFYFQEYQFGRYTADFYLPVHFIVIECDGDYWHSSNYAKKRDKAKDKALNELGITVFRFTGTAIRENVNKCVRIALG